VTLQQERFVVVDDRVGIGEIRPALPAGLYLRTGKDQTGFEGLLDRILVPRLSILSDELGMGIIPW
jgi:hypothetical protein